MLALSVLLSFIHPWGNLRTSAQTGGVILAGVDVPADVRQVLETKCSDCHSANTHWPLYGRMAPGSWLMERDVHEGREHLNLSNWQQYDLETQAGLLTKIGSEARSGQMPVKQYLLLHPQARLTPAEQQLLYGWARTERKRVRAQQAQQAQGEASEEKK